MTVQRIARPLLASIFVTGGIDAIRDPGPKARVAEPVIDRVVEEATPVIQKVAEAAVSSLEVDEGSDAVPTPAASTEDPSSTPATRASDDPTPDDRSVLDAPMQVAEAVRDVAGGAPLPFAAETYVRANGAVQVAAGLLLATGRAPRLASLALTASLVPTTLGAHRFWEVEGDERRLQRIEFTKNLGLLGGLLLSAAGGSWECPPRRRALGDGLARTAVEGAGRLATSAHHGAEVAGHVGRELADRVVDGSAGALDVLVDRAEDLAETIGSGTATVAERVAQLPR